MHNVQPDIVLANPPFGARQVSPMLRGRTVVSELRYLTWWMAHAPPTGRCGIVVPDGVLFREERAFREARERLLRDFALIAVVRLPVGTFGDAPDVRTSILFLARDIQPDAIRYYHVPRRTPSSSLRAALPPDALDGALAWVLDGTQDTYSWKVSVRDVKQGSWSLDFRWPGASANSSLPGDSVRHVDTEIEPGGQLTLLPASPRRFEAGRIEPLGRWIEKRGAHAHSIDRDRRFIGVYQSGLGPAKGRRSEKTDHYRRVEVNDFVYNPMRVAQGSVALCRGVAEEGLVSPAYVVFRLKAGAPFSAEHLLSFLKSKEGRCEIDQRSHGSLRRRLRYKDLEEIMLPVPSP